MLRQMCVTDRGWITEREFEDAIATTNLPLGPASTQLAIYCAWRLRGPVGAALRGLCFIVPGLILTLLLAALLLSKHPPRWVLGAAAGAGAAVPAVALSASWGLARPSFHRIGPRSSQRLRWVAYGALGAVAASTLGPLLVVVILLCGLVEVALRVRFGSSPPRSMNSLLLLVVAPTLGGIGSLAWVAFKVGALSYGGGFVIVPLMQHDAVSVYHWMSGAQFLNAVALGQVTPGPVVQTIAVVGYAAKGARGGLLAVAFTPSFIFVLCGAPHFEGIRRNTTVQAFLTGAGPAVVGAIAGSSIPLGLALSHAWQPLVLVGALVWLFVVRRGVLACLLPAGGVAVLLAVSGVTV